MSSASQSDLSISPADVVVPAVAPAAAAPAAPAKQSPPAAPPAAQQPAAATATAANASTQAAPPATAAAPATAADAAAGAANPPAELPDIEDVSRRRQIVWFSTSAGTSLVVHMVLLIALGLITSQGEMKQQLQDFVASEVERTDELLNQVLDQEIEPAKELTPISGVAITHTGASGNVALPSAAMMSASAQEVVPSNMQYDPGELNPFTRSTAAFSKEVPRGTVGDALQVADNYDQAMDRITQEILNRLAKGKVLVLWCFDESESMKDDREEITARIDRVYAELGMARSAQNDQLLTSICSYGKDLHTITKKPTSNVKEIQDSIRAVVDDPSGQEQMCPAILASVSAHHRYAIQGHRQLMCVVVTDESGEQDSNYAMMEQTIQECKSLRCPVYFLGREAVFGYPYGFMRYFHAASKTNHWLRIDRGPETAYAEQLQVEGYHRRHDAHASGFGPYVQARIARETNGIFFMLPSPESNLVGRDNTKYALDAMRPYLPDLSPRADYAAERDRHELRRMLWATIVAFNPYEPGKEREVQVSLTGYSIDAGTFRTQAQEQIARAKKIASMYEAAQKELERVKPQRAREDSMRWRANYDLIYAQVVAYQVRMHEFAAALEAFSKEFPKPKKPESNYWHCVNVTRTLTDAKTKALREKSVELYKYVQQQHPGTPYAARAKIELARGFGIEMREAYNRPYTGPPIVLPKF